MAIQRKLRTGLQTIQFVLAFPLVLVLFFAIIEFGFILIVQQTATAAAQEGARVAARGATAEQVLAAVNQFLAVHTLVIASTTVDANVVIEQSGAIPVEITSFACTPIGPALNPAPGEVRVTVSLALTRLGDPSVWQGGTLPNLLTLWGFGLSERTYTTSAFAPVE